MRTDRRDAWSAITIAEQAGTLGRYVTPTSNPFRVFIAPDIHWTFHDPDVVTHIIDLARGCDIIIQIGDALDCYSLSSFDRDPKRLTNVEDEADGYREG